MGNRRTEKKTSRRIQLRLENVFQKLENWWNGNEKSIVVNVSILKDRNIINHNHLWPDENFYPDFSKIVDVQFENARKIDYLGVSYPALPHQWASRGTPMVMCAYLGSEVFFGDNTVWYEKFVDDWGKTKIRFDVDNYWVQTSKVLMEEQLKKLDPDMLLWMPDLGDALTCFSMMKGVENLMFDIIERPEIILEKIDENDPEYTTTYTLNKRLQIYKLILKKIKRRCKLAFMGSWQNLCLPERFFYDDISINV